MILDALDNAHQYYGLSARIRRALEHLRATDWSAMELGHHEIDGAKVFAIVSEYETMPLEDGLWEAHRAHIDIQFVVNGEERVRYANLETLDAGPYDEEKDLIRAEGQGELFLLKPDRFVILFPQDAHSPGLVAARRERVRKVVIKIAVK